MMLHHVLIVIDRAGGVGARYSRAPEGCDGATWDYYAAQCAREGYRLLAVVEDYEHDHPPVISELGRLPNDVSAHMP